MANKSFGIKELSVISANQTPTIESATDIIVNANNVAISTNVTVGNRVGIGTTNPTSKLHIIGNALVTGVVTASSFSGNATSATYATSSGVSTSVIGGIGSITQLQVTGVSTFSNGPVFIGAATSTGTASQSLQVTGGAYVSGSVGIGTTNPTSKLDVLGNVNISGILTASKVASGIPQNTKTSAYVLEKSDVGKYISISSGGVTVPAGIFSEGDVISVYNNSAGNQTITQGTSVTMYFSGTSTTGSRTLSQRGLSTILCVGSNTFIIGGSGLS